MDALQIAYILLRFPCLTETFVADEIWEMQRRGIHVQLYSLLRPRPGPVHSTSEHLAKQVRYAPEIYSWQLWQAQLYFLIRLPLRYLALLKELIWQPYPKSFVPLFLRRVLIFLKAVSLAYEMKDPTVQMLHTHFAWLSGAATGVISKLLDIPFTVTAHAYDIYCSNDLLRFTARGASRIVAISEHNRQQILERCPDLGQDLITVIHCGINLEFFNPSVCSARYGDPLRILSIGSLIEKKGHPYLIRACQQLNTQGIDFRCTIIGSGPDENQLRQLILDHGLEGKVILVGARQRNEVLNEYRHSDLFVLASVVAQGGDQDGIPVVLMEAMAMKIPVISTRVSGIPELVRHQETGWLVPERDSAAIADAIVTLMADPALRARLVQNARALIGAEFDIERNVIHLATLFQDVGVPQNAVCALVSPAVKR